MQVDRRCLWCVGCGFIVSQRHGENKEGMKLCRVAWGVVEAGTGTSPVRVGSLRGCRLPHSRVGLGPGEVACLKRIVEFLIPHGDDSCLLKLFDQIFRFWRILTLFEFILNPLL